MESNRVFGNKVVVLVGKTYSGKTTLAEQLCSKLDYVRIHTATTRPKRIDESDGEYYYLTKTSFDIYQQEGSFLEVDEINGYKYGSFRNDYIPYTNLVVVLSPNGAYEVAKHIDEDDLLIIWLDPEEQVLLKRGVNRGDSISEVRTKLENETETFEKFEHSALADKVFYQNESVEEMVKWIDEIVSGKVAE